MTAHTIGTGEEWLAARVALLGEEKELTRRSDELARKRQALPWVAVDKDYEFATEEGTKTLAELFDGRTQLLVYHFMFGPTVERSSGEEHTDLLERESVLGAQVPREDRQPHVCTEKLACASVPAASTAQR
jgi:predicted dithiol-disulfide oxidoreductase (DUF899 family)